MAAQADLDAAATASGGGQVHTRSGGTRMVRAEAAVAAGAAACMRFVFASLCESLVEYSAV